jgi:hypothetical protein
MRQCGRLAWMPGCIVLGVLLSGTRAVKAHDGPPFPIVSDRTVGAYTIEVWTDPDTTDDGSPGGKFWVMLEAADGSSSVPPGTQVTLTVSPIERQGPAITGTGKPTGSDVSRQYVEVLLDHEGRFAVRVNVAGPLGAASVESEVDATYDLRPPPLLLALYLMPFLVIGALWIKLIRRRRAAPHASPP